MELPSNIKNHASNLFWATIFLKWVKNWMFLMTSNKNRKWVSFFSRTDLKKYIKLICSSHIWGSILFYSQDLAYWWFKYLLSNESPKSNSGRSYQLTFKNHASNLLRTSIFSKNYIAFMNANTYTEIELKRRISFFLSRRHFKKDKQIIFIQILRQHLDLLLGYLFL
jgi:hypothetical protein